jgi:hypothetical protein
MDADVATVGEAGGIVHQEHEGQRRDRPDAAGRDPIAVAGS